MPDKDSGKVSHTEFLRAFEAAVGRADRERQTVAREEAIATGERDLWVIDSMGVEVHCADAEVAPGGDDLLLPRANLPLTLTFSLKRVSAQTIVREGAPGDG